MHGQQQQETIQFYKIKLMEKDRQISDFDSKLKKIEFRNNRELKEAKTAEERAKTLLKEQKAKMDRLSKQAAENQEQNGLLQLRLTALKEEKERQVLEVRAQYNSIKEEVRSYERLLPTHTFLTELALSIQQLPTYEDVFVNLKQKVGQVVELQSKIDTLRNQFDETNAAHHQSEELLMAKKIEAERNLKQVLPRVVELEHQLSDYKITHEEQLGVIDDLRNELAEERARNTALEESLRALQGQGEQMRQAFTSQLHNKQSQVRASFSEQMERYQQEIKSLHSRLEIKENMYLSQIHILEEETAHTQARSQNERERYEEEAAEAREESEAAKAQLERMRTEAEILAGKHEEVVKNLLRVAGENEQLQEKIKNLQSKLAQTTMNHQLQYTESERRSQQEIRQHQGRHDQLQEQIRRLRESYQKLLQQHEGIHQQNQELRMQIVTRKGSAEIRPDRLEIPQNAFEFEQKYRRQSTDLDKGEQQLVQMLFAQRGSGNYRKNEELESERNSVKLELETAKLEVEGFKVKIQELESEVTAKSQQIQTLNAEIITIKTQLESEVDRSKANNEDRQRITIQSQELKQKVASLSRILSETEQQLASSTTKQNLLKSSLESLKEENRIVLEEDRKNKELLKTQKEEIKTLKEANNALTDRLAKEAKDLNTVIDLLKQQNEQLKAEFTSKEKALSFEIALLKNSKELEEKLKTQLNVLKEELLHCEQEKQVLVKKCIQLTKSYETSRKEIEKLQQQNLQKDQENEMINQSLDRQRKERTLRTVPSLQSLQGDLQAAQEQNFNDIYLTITRKQGEINILQRQISDLKEELESLRLAQASKLEGLENEQNEYIQTIIMMKVKCAEAEMRASQKEYLYNQMKKKMIALGKG